MQLLFPWLAVAASALATLAQVDAGPAFPGAEGAGASATGGHGGAVVYVTNLNDAGPGSFRDAIDGPNRTILFKVSGTIPLSRRLDIKSSNVSVIGQSAPGGGICLRGKELVISGDNVIVRFLRIRPGDELGQEHDALTIWGADHVIVDHCSLSWSTDSVNDVVRDSTNVSVQWCIVSEPLNRSVHSKGAHGYGTGWGSGPSGGNSFHHNLIAHCNSRAPRIGSEASALVDVRNNVVYNRGSGWAYGGERARVNLIGNYFRAGPDTKRPAELFRVSSPNTRLYLRDNFVEASSAVTEDNAIGLAIDEGIDADRITAADPFEVPHCQTHSAIDAYQLVLDYAGATLPSRDAVDRRIVADVVRRTGRIIDSQSDVGGWPELHSANAPQDSDSDGMPDDWERQRGLDPLDTADGATIGRGGYTHLERYLNEIAADAFPAQTPDSESD